MDDYHFTNPQPSNTKLLKVKYNSIFKRTWKNESTCVGRDLSGDSAQLQNSCQGATPQMFEQPQESNAHSLRAHPFQILL